MRARAFAVIVALCSLFACLHAQSQPAPSNRSNANAGDDNQSPPHPAIHVTVEAPKPDPNEAAREEAYRQREVVAQEDVRDFTRWLTYLTVIQAFVGLGGLLLAWRAAKAAQVSADAAIRSAELSERTLHTTQRAFLAVENLRLQVFQPGKAVVVGYRLRNTGHTRAILKRAHGQVVFGKTLPESPEYGEPFESQRTPIEVGQAHDKSFHTKHILTAEEHAAAMRQEKTFWIYGYFFYEDVFGFSHRSGFCWANQGDRLVSTGNAAYNESD
jgi:hypothetical protein